MKGSIHRRSSAGCTPGIWEGSHRERMDPNAAVFTPDIVKAMCEGFDLAWTSILAANLTCAADRFAAETRRQLAIAIVESACRGTCDRHRLSENALRSFFPLGLPGQAEQDRSDPK